jgi:hypothetical protein
MLNRIPLGGRLFLLGALVSGLVVAAMVRPVAAAPSEANEQWKFSEPERINQVGTRWINCYPPYIVQEGTMTPYSTTVWSEPCW